MIKTLRILFLLVITVFITFAFTMFMLDTSETPSTYQIHEINSKILSEKREFIVNLPAGYNENTSKAYPVVYVFGGNTLTYSISYDTDLLTRVGHLEEIIVVGVSNISQKTRQRDLTPPFMKQDLDDKNAPLGKADVYLEFISTELISFIESHYRTNSTRIAVGHSREGLMILYASTEKPTLFQGHVALSPALWRENNMFVNYFHQFLQQSDTITSSFYLSMGAMEVEKMKNAYNSTVALLNSASINRKISWKSDYIKDAIHSNNALLSAPLGISYVLNENRSH